MQYSEGETALLSTHTTETDLESLPLVERSASSEVQGFMVVVLLKALSPELLTCTALVCQGGKQCCRVCLEEDNPEKLTKPCCCSGSMQVSWAMYRACKPQTL